MTDTTVPQCYVKGKELELADGAKSDNDGCTRNGLQICVQHSF